MNNFRSERARMKMSQEDLADKVGVSKFTICNWEKDISSCSAKYLFLMTELFGCSADYLIGRTDERK